MRKREPSRSGCAELRFFLNQMKGKRVPNRRGGAFSPAACQHQMAKIRPAFFGWVHRFAPHDVDHTVWASPCKQQSQRAFMRVSIIVPCFNEVARLDGAALSRMLVHRNWRLVLVNDGSTDGTRELLDTLERDRPGAIRALHLEKNSGKAEAVRAGLNASLADSEVVAYCDADLATPADEMVKVIEAAARPDIEMALGARVRLLGHDIQRTTHRHYLGRVFASLASFALQMPVYDTQCGAKAIRVTPALKRALATPFRSRWVFDVELISRLKQHGMSANALVEVPLLAWRDVKGSKLKPREMLTSVLDLGRISLAARKTPPNE